MPDPDIPILPSTRVADLLDRYPQLEDVLIHLAPPFRKLKNPLLRKGVAKVASLRHAAVAGGIPERELIEKLRAAVGQSPIAASDLPAETSYFGDQPDWFEPANIVASIDERSADPDRMTISSVLPAAVGLQSRQILELITTFIPAPGIDILRRKGYLVWSMRDEAGLVRTFVSKPGEGTGV